MKSRNNGIVPAICLLSAIAVSQVLAADPAPTVLFDMDTVRHRPTTSGDDKRPIGTVSVVPGKFGQASRFQFEEGARSGFFTAAVRPTPDWDRAAGLSFYVKGDGSSSFGGIELIDRSNYALRYAYCFPIDSTEWRKITVPWRDLLPELPAGDLVDAEQGYRPSGFGNLWFGKWHYWRDYPACSFAIDQVVLEPSIPVDETDHTPAESGATRLLARLEAGRPVTIVTLGDSLSDRLHWANRDVLWSQRLVERLEERFDSEVTLVNPAIGGSQLTQGLILMPRWLNDTPKPDLVTVWFGYNDWTSGMRGPRFEKMLRAAVDRIRRMTGGHAEVMLLTTCPAMGRWDTMEELAEAVRRVAAEKKTALVDVSVAFRRAGAEPSARAKLYCRDQTHLGRAGHELAAEVVFEAITKPGQAEETAQPPKQDGFDQGRHPVSKEHPRLLGSRQRLKRLAEERPEAYQRVVRVAREQKADDHAKIISMALVSAIEEDEPLGRQVVEMAIKMVDGPIRQGHVTFGHDLARCAIAYDLCHEFWTPQQRARFHDYMNKTIDANVRSESHVFHNGWYGYKNWGVGLACYAAYHENPRAAALLRALERDYLTRAAPALELAGDGGGWAEGYYVNYWLYEWLFFCEAARRCEGVDYQAAAPKFFRNRATAGMFESYPGIGEYRSRRPVPIGDGGGRLFGGDRDKVLSARRILVNRFRDDPDHQVVHTFNEATPRSAVGVYAYKDFLWRDTTVRQGDLTDFRLSHYSPGPGFVYARGSWDDDATYFFFKCGDRFTAHQHLDVGHFLIYKNAELAGDGGHYDGFGTSHDVNYHLRTIAHNTVLVHDPAETWPGIRAGKVTGNDGGQAHAWPHHNGAVTDPAAWRRDRQLYDIADVTAFEDHGDYLYVAGDCTRAYSPKKLEAFTRQIVYLRPGTFVIFDRVATKDPQFKKTWLLQAMKRPEPTGPDLVVTNGQGRLFVQTVLPRRAEVRLADGPDPYRYDGQSFPPNREVGAAPECRIEVSPSEPSAVDYFLHVLTATDASVASVPRATIKETEEVFHVDVGEATIRFTKKDVGVAVDFPPTSQLAPNPSVRPFTKKIDTP